MQTLIGPLENQGFCQVAAPMKLIVPITTARMNMLSTWLADP